MVEVLRAYFNGGQLVIRRKGYKEFLKKKLPAVPRRERLLENVVN